MHPATKPTLASFDSADRVHDAELARDLVNEAGELLLEIRSTSGMTGSDLGRIGDVRSHELLADRLCRERPSDAVLSEESVDDPARLNAERVWILDPLDGTREYGEGDRPDWAVHVALWERGGLAHGAVALPAARRTLSSLRPPSLPEGMNRPLRLAVSRSRPPGFVMALVDRLGAVTVPMGSAGYKACAVLTGEVDAYVHAGGQYEWDSAAPVAVAEAAGCHTSRIDGSPLKYNSKDPLLPDLVVAVPWVAQAVLDGIDQLVREGGVA